jgi:F-type H+-transporting ATPase subunit delta
MKEIDVKKLFEMALDEVVALEEGLYSFTRLMRDNYDLCVFFENAAVTPEQKKKMFADLHPGAEPILKQVVDLLIDEGLEKSTGQLSEELTKLVSERLKITFADVVTPFPLTDGERVGIEKFVGDKAHLRVKIDPSLIGGIRVMTSDGRLLDGSLKGTIERLKEELTYAG